jgi:hypothetical protein
VAISVEYIYCIAEEWRSLVVEKSVCVQVYVYISSRYSYYLVLVDSCNSSCWIVYIPVEKK